MNRRDFLGLLRTVPIAAACGPALGTVLVPKRAIFLPRRTRDISAMDGDRYARPITSAEFRRILEPELNRLFAESYRDKQWLEIFDGERWVSLASDTESDMPTVWGLGTP
jgi:hypothetical protein